jgi:predicted acetyltransferase
VPAVNVQVTPAAADDRERLRALLELYVYDFSELCGLDVGDDGRFRVPTIDHYFADPRCHPFLLRADERLAGFALVQGKSRLSGDESVYDMAEFFVLRRYRRRGVGERAAQALFARFTGPWEVREREGNDGATAFWRRAIGRYTDGKFEELRLDDERWRGPVQRFDSRR